MRRAAAAAVGQAAAVSTGTDAPAPVEAAKEPVPAAENPEPAAARHLHAVDRPSAAARSDRQAPSSPMFGPVRDGLCTRLTGKVVVDPHMLPRSREQYRRLAATLHQGQTEHGIKVIMLTSALPGEGKTLTSSNLALTFSESYHRRVLLIDADLRRPSLHQLFDIDGTVGLTEGLTAAEDQPLALHRVSPHLTVLPAGRPTTNPMDALTSDRMQRLVAEARDVFDWVIVDTPPVGLIADANLLAAMADGALLVIKAESTPYPVVRRAVDTLGRDRVLGVVLNQTLADTPTSKYDYAGYYSAAAASRQPVS
jgi:capsular exopolysaccharide synthesis family protein